MGSNYVSQFAKWDYPISATLRVPRGVSLSPNDDPMIFFSWNSYCETEIEDCFAKICQATKGFYSEI